VEPLTILDSKTVTSAGVSKRQVLVQWTGLSPDDTSWEDWDKLSAIYNLEDKVGLDGEGIVTYTPLHTREESTSDEPNKMDETGPVYTKPKRVTKPPEKHKDYVKH
jgi:hypothetical protein